MKIHFYYYGDRIKMWSEGEIEAPALEHVMLDVATADLDKLKNGWIGKIENGTLLLALHPRVERIAAIQSLKDQLVEPTTLPQLKTALRAIIKLLE